MKKVITYGTFDLFHIGHLNLLKRAKALGDYLIVGVTSENYDRSRGKLNVRQSLAERIDNVKRTGLADEIIVEEYEGQKIEDIQKYNVDIFVIGSDWKGKFDYLKKYCEVVYLPRTKGISSTQLRGIVKLGIVGYGRIANRFVPESRYVSGVEVVSVFGPNLEKAKKFVEKHDIEFYTDSFDELLSKVDAVYVASPHPTHFQYAKRSLLSGKHVLVEKPMALSKKETQEIYDLAKENGLVALEAIKTAYLPAFIRLIALIKTEIIGEVLSVDATFTKLLQNENTREFDPKQKGGSVTELISYPLLPVVKIFGTDLRDLRFYSFFNEKGVDVFTTVTLIYKNGIANTKVGLKAKAEGDMVITGTKGYIYVPSPWWKTEYFEIRDDNGRAIRRISDSFMGEGLRYEIAEFIRLIQSRKVATYKLKAEESVFIADVVERFLNEFNLTILSI